MGAQKPPEVLMPRGRDSQGGRQATCESTKREQALVFQTDDELKQQSMTGTEQLDGLRPCFTSLYLRNASESRWTQDTPWKARPAVCILCAPTNAHGLSENALGPEDSGRRTASDF